MIWEKGSGKTLLYLYKMKFLFNFFFRLYPYFMMEDWNLRNLVSLSPVKSFERRYCVCICCGLLVRFRVLDLWFISMSIGPTRRIRNSFWKQLLLDLYRHIFFNQIHEIFEPSQIGDNSSNFHFDFCGLLLIFKRHAIDVQWIQPLCLIVTHLMVAFGCEKECELDSIEAAAVLNVFCLENRPPCVLRHQGW